jgi:hypothetical protein
MTTSTVTPEIAAFAAGVRAALADLTPDELGELTGGLEADLAESLAEDLRRTLPDPVAYAAELRAAADLPYRSQERGGLAAARRALGEGWRDARADLEAAARRSPALVAVLDFLTVLRPAWWIGRALLATWMVAAFFGSTSLSWLVLVVFVVVSVQWGRRQWLLPGVPTLVVLGNVIAVVALVPALMAVLGSDDYPYDETAYYGSMEGLRLDGAPVENIYAYDAAGKPLRNVQLFDVDGHPIEASRNVEETWLQPQPATLETGVEAYNVFPMSLVKVMYDDMGELVPDPAVDADKAAAYRDGPFLKVPPVAVPKTEDAPEKVAPSNQ